MTKDGICKVIQMDTGIDRQTIHAVIESFIGNVKKNVAAGEPVFLRGFGTFTTKRRAEKKARNISLNQTIVVPEHEIPYLKPSASFENLLKTQKINKKG